VQPDRLSALAEELVRLPVDLVVVSGNAVAQAAKEATTTIPIVMLIAADVVETGLVASLARPGGNITGRSDSAIELDGKLLELLKETVPQVTRVAILWEASIPYSLHRFTAAQDAARAPERSQRPETGRSHARVPDRAGGCRGAPPRPRRGRRQQAEAPDPPDT
jgi:ABC-type uncharacterized transport system substrate-binding protein